MTKATGKTGLMIAPRERPRKTLVLLSLNGDKTKQWREGGTGKYEPSTSTRKRLGAYYVEPTL